jgi:uncharacterized protein (DUF433 family)
MQLKLCEHKMRENWKAHIVSNPEILRGKPRIKGTRIPVSLILGYLAAGHDVEHIIEDFGDISQEDIAAWRNFKLQKGWGTQ